MIGGLVIILFESFGIFFPNHSIKLKECLKLSKELNNIYKLVKHVFDTCDQELKRQSMKWKHTDFLVKKRFYVSKECHANNLLGPIITDCVMQQKSKYLLNYKFTNSIHPFTSETNKQIKTLWKRTQQTHLVKER